MTTAIQPLTSGKQGLSAEASSAGRETSGVTQSQNQQALPDRDQLSLTEGGGLAQLQKCCLVEPAAVIAEPL